jgi:hypothetical protein
MRKLICCGLLWLACTAAASAQSVVITNIERDTQGRVSTITSTSNRGTMRTEVVHNGTNSRATTTYERANSGYNPLGQGGYHPLGR